jgi:hypothetical protein
MNSISFSDIATLTAGKLGRHDVACPICGPSKRSPANQRRRVLRIWHVEPNFATFSCARCEVYGYAHDRSDRRIDPAVIKAARDRAEKQRQLDIADGLKKSLWLWRQRKIPQETIVEKYLRDARGYTGQIPATIGFLPARDGHHPVMISAFGCAVETRPGELEIYDTAVRGVHLTKLKLDGSGKAGTEADKITIGRGNTSPIMLAPPNDGLGLVIAEGIEDALSAHVATGLGAWAAGSAPRLSAMAEWVPAYIETVTIMVDSDDAGERNAAELAHRLDQQGIEVLLVRPGASA